MLLKLTSVQFHATWAKHMLGRWSYAACMQARKEAEKEKAKAEKEAQKEQQRLAKEAEKERLRCDLTRLCEVFHTALRPCSLH